MSGRPALVRRVVSALALVGILTVASAVLRTAPTEAQWQAPVDVRGDVGDEVDGRNIAATVERVRIARTVTASTGWVGETAGLWVVVDVRAQAVVTEYATGLGTAELVVGDDTYSASTRPGLGTVAGQPLAVGVPLGGPLLFEVPADAVTSHPEGTALVRLAASTDPRLDSLLVVPVDLAGVRVEDSITTAEPDLGPA